MRRRGGGRSVLVLALLALVGVLPVGAASSPATAQDAPIPPLPAAVTTVDPTPSGGQLVTRELALSGPGAVTGRTERAAAKGWSTEVGVPAGTTMVDLTWAARTGAVGEVEVRTRLAAGGWSAWEHLASEADEAPDGGGNGRTGVGPVFVGSEGTDRVQVRVASGTLPDVRLDAMRWQAPSAAAPIPTVRMGGPSGPAIHPRSEWAPGGWHVYPGCTKAPVAMDQLRFVVIHHTVNSNTYRPSDVPGLLAGIYRYHTTSRRWCDVAYNFFVDRFGGVWQGRSGAMDAPIMGGHAKGFNTDSMGVALLGQYESGAPPTSAAPSAAALASVRSLLTWKLAIHGLDPKGKVRIVSRGSTKYASGRVVTLPVIQGHQDSSLTDCPGNRLYPQLAALRAGVAADLAKLADPTPWAPYATGPAYFGRIWSDVAGKPPTNTRAAQLTSQVVRDGRTLPQVVADIAVASQSDSRIGVVDRLYTAFVGRHPDTPTLDALVRRRDAGAKLADLAADLAATPEFRARFGRLAPAALASTVYRSLLGRAPNAKEQADIVRQLTSGASPAQFVARVAGSSEHARKRWADSAIAITWFGLLREAPGPATFARWTPTVEAGQPPVDAVAAVLASAEFRERLLEG